jgi:hypothetical protein
MGLGKSTDFDNGFKAGVAKGKLDMYRMVVDLMFDLIDWADEATDHDESAEFCDICTVLDKLQLDIMLLGQQEGKNR